jgi:hypothetical protein
MEQIVVRTRRSGNTPVSLPHLAHGITAKRHARQLLRLTEQTA